MSDTAAPERRPTRSGYLSFLSDEAFDSLGSMEGILEPAVEMESKPVAVGDQALWPGVVASIIVAFAAYLISKAAGAELTIGSLPIPVSAGIVAILLGLLARNLLRLPKTLTFGCKRIVKKVIPVAIVLTGAKLDLVAMRDVGLPVLTIIVLTMTIAIFGTYKIGRLLGLGRKVSLLLGVGTGVCGNSAIVAAAPLIDADDEDLVLSIGTVNLFGLLAMLACVLIGANLSAQVFGVWAGTTIHAVPQVVAAGMSHSMEAGTLATLVKLVRVALLAPLVFVLALMYARSHSADRSGRHVVVHYARFVPWFVWGFVIVAVVGAMGLIPELQFDAERMPGWMTGYDSIALADVLGDSAKVLLALAMAAIGLEVNLRLLVRVSGKAVLCGLLSTTMLAIVGMVLIRLLM